MLTEASTAPAASDPAKRDGCPSLLNPPVKMLRKAMFTILLPTNNCNRLLEA
jgi:hypothetical protein